MTGRLWLVLAYAVPAVAVWMLVGLLISAAPAARIAVALIVAYGAYYGLIEATGRPGLPPPGRSWQVPSHWVDSAPGWRRMLVWGALLGPGFTTRNPYAGFGLLPLVLLAVGNLRLGVMLAALLGLLHGTGRAAALLRGTRPDAHSNASAAYLQHVMRSIRWRTLDGLALLTVAGAGVTTLVLRW